MNAPTVPDTTIDLLEQTLVKLDAMIAHATNLRVQVIELLCDTRRELPRLHPLASVGPVGAPMHSETSSHVDLMDVERRPLGAPVCVRSFR